MCWRSVFLHFNEWNHVCCCCLAAKLCTTLLQPHGLKTTRLLFPWIFQTRIWEWVAISFRGSSKPRDGTYISCIDRQILYHRATREAQNYIWLRHKILHIYSMHLNLYSKANKYTYCKVQSLIFLLWISTEKISIAF